MFVFLTHFLTVYSDDCIQNIVLKKKWSKFWWPASKLLLESTEMGRFGWVSSIHDVQIWKVTAPAKDHLTHWNPQKLLCTVCYSGNCTEFWRTQVFYVKIECLGFQKVNAPDIFFELGHSHTTVSCPTCLNVALRQSRIPVKMFLLRYATLKKTFKQKRTF